VPAGWDIAPGDADDVRVCGAHPLQSSCLLFADGSLCGTAMCRDSSYYTVSLLLGTSTQPPATEFTEILGQILPHA
jgi:hypothetical protein